MKPIPLQVEPPALRLVGQKVAKVNGVNLAQGLCMLPVPEPVKQGACHAINSGKNMYGPAHGIPELRQALSKRLREFNGIQCSEESLVITPGSSGAFEVVCEAFLRPGDEAAAFIPFYPYHRNTLKRRGAKINFIELRKPDWSFSLDDLKRSITPKTKFILVTTPHNPTGKVFTRVELESIAQLCREYDIACVTDEVYEYLTYDGREHLSIATLPGMAERTITMGSYSKTFAITGWRIGYLVSPPSTHELLKTIADQMFVCTPIPLQHGVACGITELGPEFYSSMLSGYTRKRGIISKALLKAGFPHEPPQGAYYLTAETTERFPGQTSEQVVDILIEKAHVAGVPASDFLGPEVKGDPSRSNFIRFSFAVPDEMLERAAKGLERL